MAKIPQKTPFPLSGRLASVSQQIFSRQGREVDIAISGVPFRVATSDEYPYRIQTADVRKEQQDIEQEPGEQSLSGWWRRSQDSFHEGAGALYQENRGQVEPSSRFRDSRGVDVWTPGEIRLLKRMVSTAHAAIGRVSLFSTVGSDDVGVAVVQGTALKSLSTIDDASLTTVHDALTPLADALISNDQYYALTTAGTVLHGTVGGGAPVSYVLTGASGATGLAFAKHRLWAIASNRIFQPPLSGGAVNPTFIHPDAGWRYTAIAEGPTAVYFAGHNGHSSSIQAITLDDSGGVPVLTGARQTVILPDGELVQEIQVLAGQFIGIGTSRGFRVGVIDGENITYGPLFLSPDDTLECTAITTMDRFFLVGFRSTGGERLAYRVDSSLATEEGEFAYAPDIETGIAGWLVSVASTAGRAVAVDEAGNYYYQHATEHVDSGFIQTGRIRFRTNEPKVFKYLQVETQPLDGAIQVTGEEENGTTFDINSFTVQDSTLSERVDMSGNLPTQRSLALRFLLTPTADLLQSPVLNSYLVLALPATSPQFLYQVPLLCFDRELGRSGHEYGYDGYGQDRATAVRDLESNGGVIVFQDFTGVDDIGITAQIEQSLFVQNKPNEELVRRSGNGGILVLTLRTL